MIITARTLRRCLATVGPVVALALVASACGSTSSSSTANGASANSTVTSKTTTQVSHAKTKFVLHAGLAFGAFHRWIYKPLKAGDFSHPLSHKLTVVKAALAGAFTYHELKLALQDAQADPTLSKLVAPITALQNKMDAVASGLKHGNVDSAGITGINGTIASIHQQAASAGQAITEQTPSTP